MAVQFPFLPANAKLASNSAKTGRSARSRGVFVPKWSRSVGMADSGQAPNGK